MCPNRWLPVLAMLLVGASDRALSQQQVTDPDELLTQMTKIVFDSLAASRASIASHGRDVILGAIDQGVSQVEREGLTEANIRRALFATRQFAGRIIEQSIMTSGRVRFGENTPSYVQDICPLWPFC